MTDTEHRPLEIISAEMDALDRQIEELNRRKSELAMEHDEVAALENPTPIFF